MKENVDKQLDDLNRKVMGTSSVEQTSTDFTKNLMSQIHSLNRSSLFRYKPLIATPVWVGLAVLVVTVFGYVFIATSETASETKKNLALNAFLEHNLANPFSGLEMSQAGVYAVVLFCLMLCIQIPILKHYLDKRY